MNSKIYLLFFTLLIIITFVSRGLYANHNVLMEAEKPNIDTGLNSLSETDYKITIDDNVNLPDINIITKNISYQLRCYHRSRNEVINFGRTTLFGLTYGHSDDVAPMHIQNATIGANHGWRADVLNSPAHGLTNENIGEDWDTSDGNIWTVMKINDADNFTVIKKSNNLFFHDNNGFSTIKPLTRDGVTLTIADKKGIQYYPSVKHISRDLFVDDKLILGNKVSKGNKVTLVEEYDILNRESLRANVTNIDKALASVNVKNSYEFVSNGASYVFAKYKINHPIIFKNIMAAQAIMLNKSGYFYAPKLLPFKDGVDLRKLTLYSALNTKSRFFTNDLWETGKVPNRVTTYTADKTKAMMIGILTDRGVGKSLTDYTFDTFEIRGNTGKIYPHPVSSSAIGGQLQGGEEFDIAMFRAYFEPEGNVDVVELPFEEKTIVIIDIHEIGNFTVNLSASLNGKAITVTDSHNIVFKEKIVVDSKIEVTTSSDYAYLELEVK